MNKIFVGFICLALSGLSDQIVAEEKNRDLVKIQAEIDAVNRNIKRIEKEQGALLTQLAEIEKYYGKTVATLKQLQGQIDSKQRKIKDLREKTRLLQLEIAEQNEGLRHQVKAAYAMGRKEKLKLMLNQEDPALSSRIMVYYEYLNKARLEKLARIGQAVMDINELERENLKESQLLEQTLQLKKTEQEALDRSRLQRKELLTRLEKDYSSSKLRLSQLREGEARLQNLVNGLQQAAIKQPFEPEPGKPVIKQQELVDWPVKPFASSQGDLPWPVKGQLVKKFGSPRLGSRWDGVLIGAGEGTEIRAVSAGKIVFADWLRGYGLLTIIDHGNGYMTLYAFNQSLYKSVGDRVAPGDVIASVGKSGGRSKAGLYFGIRKNGKPVDPVRWCRKIDQDRTG
ncbi:murein hydrolase activator EnvC family protein [Methylotuvimicrobium buryatense]|uniref:Peptidase M23 n=1 Tax=Methylotuvimicrobium buryatense TaxID=95641 RepID=A0A4P9UM93_METBY|nr:peptidoglycan DD-metalloendopeptidase family protein [Methylotuvimicrobium buryatense]QCW81281.1 peptidase M23 [Methylotuvimicrobium buryatense]